MALKTKCTRWNYHPKLDLKAVFFRCASISCFQVVSNWVSERYFFQIFSLYSLTVSAVSTVTTVSTVSRVSTVSTVSESIQSTQSLQSLQSLQSQQSLQPVEDWIHILNPQLWAQVKDYSRGSQTYSFRACKTNKHQSVNKTGYHICKSVWLHASMMHCIMLWAFRLLNFCRHLQSFYSYIHVAYLTV